MTNARSERDSRLFAKLRSTDHKLRDENKWGDDGKGRWLHLGELSGKAFDAFVDTLTPNVADEGPAR